MPPRSKITQQRICLRWEILLTEKVLVKEKGKQMDPAPENFRNPIQRLKNQRVLESKLEIKQYQITNRFTFKCLCGKKIYSNSKIQCSYFQLRLEYSVYKLM
ncbi:hypothetical protein VIGAN_02318000 [Vigna angularis var. angularis]|uniref:Uncharacterized protein n=1 Tax=Vigna angularis var. angularis TaxID=157739 RepID=A0A0S3RHY5_PHAAN|nr:uncharacterized protein LOC108321056 [Vigna angularis]BAT80186.1 hypothetical protein VIGAN_02318000 [Vigna angularis var. angularis]